MRGGGLGRTRLRGTTDPVPPLRFPEPEPSIGVRGALRESARPSSPDRKENTTAPRIKAAYNVRLRERSTF